MSGNGLINIYQFLKNTEKYGQESTAMRESIKQADDVAQVISEARLAKQDALCEALELFVSLNQGKLLEGNRAVIAAGTGLGKVK